MSSLAKETLFVVDGAMSKSADWGCDGISPCDHRVVDDPILKSFKWAWDDLSPVGHNLGSVG